MRPHEDSRVPHVRTLGHGFQPSRRSIRKQENCCMPRYPCNLTRTSRYRNQFLRSAALVASLTLLATLLWRFPPSRYPFYPRCPIYTAFHLQCPGCGTTRALAALLRGHVAEALRWNALTVCALPASVLYAAYCWVRSVLGMSSPPRSVSPRLLSAAFGVVLLFTVIRNL